MIELGLSRIQSLLSTTPLPWRALHIAGTNGKGSVCATLSCLFEAYNASPLPSHTGHAPLRHARFTSPHLVERWDGIVLGPSPVSRATFLAAEARVQARNVATGAGASEFELLTATAFECFSAAGVEVGVVEVGMGGARDATNVLGWEGPDCQVERAAPLGVGITDIGLDHVEFLGPDLRSIAREKAGVIKRGVPVVAARQGAEVQAVIAEAAERAGTRDLVFVDRGTGIGDVWVQNGEGEGGPGEEDGGPVQDRWANGAIAVQLAWKALKGLGRLDGVPAEMRLEMMRGFREAVGKVVWHGRLERVNISPVVGYDLDVVLDGAHNVDSARMLRRYLDDTAGNETATTWVLATSSARKVKEILPILLRPGDSVRAVEFGPVDGMPWIKPVKGEDIVKEAAELTNDSRSHRACDNRLQETLEEVCADARQHNRRVVITGSLYLISEVYRLLRKQTAEI